MKKPRRENLAMPASLAASLLCAALICVMWLATWQRTRFEDAQALASARTANANLVLAYEENAKSALEQVEQLLRLVETEARDDPAKMRHLVEGDQWPMNHSLIRGLVVVGSDRVPVASNREAGLEGAMTNDVIQAAIDTPGEMMHVGRTEKTTASQDWRIPLARRIEAADGRLLGVAVALVDPAYFTRFYGSADLGRDGLVILIGRNGYSLARRGGNRQSFDDDMRKGTSWKRHFSAPTGSFISSGGHDGVRRIVSYRTVPVFGGLVQVGTSFAEEREAVAERARLYIEIAAVISFLAILVTLYVVRSLLRQRRDFERIKIAEMLRRASEERMRAIAESMAGGIVTADRRGTILSVNRAACLMFGYASEEMRGMPLSRVCIPSERDRLGSVFAELNAREGDFRETGREFATLRKDGTAFQAEILISSLTLAGERSYIGIVHDISERKRMEAELRASDARLRASFDQALVGIAHAALDGRFAHMNDAFAEMLGYRPDELIGRDYAGITHPDDVAASRARTEELIAGRSMGTLSPIEKRFIRKDGSTVWTLMTLTLIRGADGQPGHFAAMIQDITELKATERLKNEFISTVSHELRTPLTSINGSLGLIAAGVGGAVPPPATELVRIAARNCERLIRLVNDILDTEKLASGRMPFDMKVADLGPLVAHVTRANEGFARARNVVLAYSRPTGPVAVEVDTDRFEQLLTNLISNAVKFSPEGGTVEIALARDHAHAHVSVRDSGSGIPSDFQPRMFQRFAQADGSASRKKGGTGLGLHIAKAIAERLGGTIGFETAPGAGTTFHVRLPIADAEDDQSPARAADLQEA